MDEPRLPRVLTHDERKAAEAAFSGRQFNPAWSESAKKVYEGLIHALPQLPDESAERQSPILPSEPDPVEANIPRSSLPESKEDVPAGTEHGADVSNEAQTNQIITSRQQAIQGGFLIDVSADAKKLGLTFPVTVTKPLWEIGIAADQSISETEKTERLRDILMAFRLRIASQATLSPLFDFPAMLSLPPGDVPQPVPLFALIQPDEHNRAVVTLLLPNEVSASVIPMN